MSMLAYVAINHSSDLNICLFVFLIVSSSGSLFVCLFVCLLACFFF